VTTNTHLGEIALNTDYTGDLPANDTTRTALHERVDAWWAALTVEDKMHAHILATTPA
jgi:hypothetical protein